MLANPSHAQKASKGYAIAIAAGSSLDEVKSCKFSRP
jgi:hypothetical protein